MLVMETRRVLGKEHPDTPTSMGDFGWWKVAEDLQVLVIETRRRVLGEEHPLSLRFDVMVFKDSQARVSYGSLDSASGSQAFNSDMLHKNVASPLYW